MAQENQNFTKEQKKAAVFLTRPRLRFEPKSPERLATEAKTQAEEQARLEAESYAKAQPGDTMPDGTIFAGLSPETGQQMVALSADAGAGMAFNEAARYAKKLNGEKNLGHDDWRVPSKDELNVLLQNKDKGALKGTFNITGFISAGWYWSSTPVTESHAWTQRFSDGIQNYNGRLNNCSVRCVRTASLPSNLSR